MSTEVNEKPQNVAELADLIESLTVFDYVKGGDGYEKSADAMWKAALAAFNYVGAKVGATGFQASWSALRFYGEAMHVKGPFMVTRVEDALYPQYDLVGKVAGYIEEQSDWLREQAVERLQGDLSHVHPDVLAHWHSLVGQEAG